MIQQMQEGGIRHAVLADLDRVMEIYEIAKSYMKRSGNPNQWNGSYPERSLLESDIERECLYVYENMSGVLHKTLSQKDEQFSQKYHT